VNPAARPGYFFQGCAGNPGTRGDAGFGGCLGFFFSRLLRCWPLGMLFSGDAWMGAHHYEGGTRPCQVLRDHDDDEGQARQNDPILVMTIIMIVIEMNAQLFCVLTGDPLCGMI